MRTSAEPLEGNQVKLTVEVDEEEIRRAEDDTFRRLTREARVPGFRPGKAPRRLLEARLGPKIVREEVLRDMLPRVYADAVVETSLDVIAPPEIDVTSGEESGPVAFDAVVEVRPRVSVVGYEGLEITLPALEPTDEEIDGQVDRLREQFAELRVVDRAAADGDLVTIDLRGSRDGAPAEGLTADDLVYEVGTGGIVEAADDRLRGASAGTSFSLDADDAPGGPAHLEVAVKQVREKVLPDTDDAFASDASEFETIGELRADLRSRLARVRHFQARLALRERAVEALAALVADEPPTVLVAEETERLANELVHRLSHQQATVEDYLEATGQSGDDVLAQLGEQAKLQVKADLALRALAEAEGIEVDESEIDEEIVRIAEQEKQAPSRVRSLFEREGRMAGLRSQLRSAKALTWLVEHVAIVDDEGRPMERSELLLDLDEQSEDVVPEEVEG
ncbi:MAG: trigger factor [Acidimicrobiales bacterium]